MLNNARVTQVDGFLIETMRFVLAVALVTAVVVALIFAVPYAALAALRIMVRVAVVFFVVGRQAYAAFSYEVGL